jgi:hypothetical protein
METAPMITDSARRRINVPKRLVVVGHGRTIRRTQHEDGRRSADLERRLQTLERRVGFIADLLLGLVSACFAVAGAVYVSGGFHLDETIGAAIIAFFVAMWMANCISRRVPKNHFLPQSHNH